MSNVATDARALAPGSAMAELQQLVAGLRDAAMETLEADGVPAADRPHRAPDDEAYLAGRSGMLPAFVMDLRATG